MSDTEFSWANLGWFRPVVTVLALVTVVFHLLAVSQLFIVPQLLFRSLHLLLAITLAFIVFRSSTTAGRSLDLLLFAVGLASVGYMVWNYQAISERPAWTSEASLVETAVAIGTVLVVLELTRRALGWGLVSICLVFLAYTWAGPYLRYVDFLRPFAHRGTSLSELVDQLYFSYEGIFGLAIGVSAQYIFLFIVFGSLLSALGGGEFFIRLSRAVAGGFRGGPAKIAVIASALFGSVSGSAAANVVATGSLTIPMMKRLGYRPVFAGSVEAIASTGGQIMPPIMGAGAFIMAEILGVTYFDIVLAAAFPAFLYVLTCLLTVHSEALRLDLGAVPASERERGRDVLRDGWIYTIPLISVFGCIFAGLTPSFTAMIAVLMTLFFPQLFRKTRNNLPAIRLAIETAAISAVPIVIACAAAGIIIGVTGITGLGLKFSGLIIDFSGGNVIVALVLTMLASILMGMGLPTTAAYIIQAAIVVPALIDLDIRPIAAHLFCFYYAIMSQITPPVALASFAAAPMAGVSPSRLGFFAFRMALPIFFIPFVFVLDPKIMLPTPPLDLIDGMIRSVGAIFVAVAASVGWFGGRNLRIPGRLALVLCALAIIHEGYTWTAAGFVVASLIWFWQRRHAITQSALPLGKASAQPEK